ncbi:MAG TPA: rhomboid family intramembrane serine protease [Armatimonadota bacterium]
MFLTTGAVLTAQAMMPYDWGSLWLLAPSHVSIGSALTYAFFHADVLHWAVNMAFLLLIGPRLERGVGTPALLAYFVLGSAVAGLLHVSMVYLFMPAEASQPLLGSSGGISALLGVYTVRYYNVRLSRLAVPVSWVLCGWLASEVLLGWLEIAAGRGAVAHWAHIGGFLAGMSLAVMTGMYRAGRREDAVTQKSLDQKARRLAEYLRDHPDDATSRGDYAGVLLQLGETEKAARTYARTMEIHLEHGRNREAADAYLAMRAAALEAPRPAFEMRAAHVLEETGHAIVALAVYDRLAADEGPEAESAALRAAVLCERLDRNDDARSRYQAFVLMFPDSQFAPQARRSVQRLVSGGGREGEASPH